MADKRRDKTEVASCWSRAPLFARVFVLGAIAVAAVCGSAHAAEPPHGGLASLTDLTQPNSHEIVANSLISSAQRFLGTPYRYGGTSQDSGMDCSGLLNVTFRETLGVKMPRRSMDLSKLGSPVKRSDLQPGDLVFFNTLQRNYSHSGLYIGDGKFIHAASRGKERLVRINNIDDDYYRTRFQGGRRLPLAPTILPSRTGVPTARWNLSN